MTFVSAEKLEELKQELETRKRETRREIAERISSAKELGDLSENFEYHEAKDQQAQNELRIVQLEDMIVNASIVEKSAGADIITLGVRFDATLTETNTSRTFEMVGSAEADPMAGKISNESPFGKAFMGKKSGDEVVVELPAGTKTYQVTAIH